jgi:hypothetical protein
MRFLLRKNLKFGFLHRENPRLRRKAFDSTPQSGCCERVPLPWHGRPAHDRAALRAVHGRDARATLIDNNSEMRPLCEALHFGAAGCAARTLI